MISLTDQWTFLLFPFDGSRRLSGVTTRLGHWVTGSLGHWVTGSLGYWGQANSGPPLDGFASSEARPSSHCITSTIAVLASGLCLVRWLIRRRS